MQKATEKKPIKNKKKVLIIVLSVILGVIAICVLVGSLLVYSSVKATKEYNAEAAEYNLLVNEYNEKARKVALYNIEGMPTQLNEISLVSDSFSDVFSSLLSGNSREKILNDVETIKELKKAVIVYDAIAEKVYAPDSAEICSLIKGIEHVKDVDRVSEGKDPDAVLGTEGGYIGCVYFSLDMVDQSIVPGNDVIEKGTDAGGSIEIYATAKDAENRCDYLSQFDDTILYTGSYAAVGTMVIRTSYLLDFDDQVSMTNEITKAITGVALDKAGNGEWQCH